MDLSGITLGQIAMALAFVAGVIGSVTAIWKVYGKYKAKELEQIQQIIRAEIALIEAELAETKRQLQDLQDSLQDNNIQTARIDLNTAIEHTPHEHEAILKLAEHYFLDLGGDAWMSGKFRKWANDKGVDISYIMEQVPHLRGK